MRISDWSSDVCSSDLPEDGIDGIAGGAPGGAPFVQDGAAGGGDPVVAPRWAGHRRPDVAFPQPGRTEVAPPRIQRTLLAAAPAVPSTPQPLADLFAVPLLPPAPHQAPPHHPHRS